MPESFISIGGARQHNLKNLSLKIPRNKFVVITGLSGSGKSSLAFDTIYAEGQRKYVESLSAYARQFLDQMQKPDVDFIDGLSPAIAIEQRSSASNPRSTIATTTEIYDYLRLLYAHLGQPHCPKCGKPISSQTVQDIVAQLLALPLGTQLMVLAPLVRNKKGEFRDVFEKVRNQGFVRVRVDGQFFEVDRFSKETEDVVTMERWDKNRHHNIEVVVDRLPVDPKFRVRITDSVETALKWGQGVLVALTRIGPDTKTNRQSSPTMEEETWTETLYSTMNACMKCGISLGEFTPRHFSFNSPYGACPTCHGIGQEMVFDPDLVVPDPDKSIEQGAIVSWRRGGRRLIVYYKMLLRNVCAHLKINMNMPWKDLPKTKRETVLYGAGDEKVTFRMFRNGKPHILVKSFEGVIPQLQRLFAETTSEFTRKRLRGYQTFQHCAVCGGARLRKESLAVMLQGKSIIDITRFSVTEALRFFDLLTLTSQQQTIGQQALQEVRSRLGFLAQVGLGYLTLDRESGTLSGGEAQRIKLTTQIGSKLSGVIYVLDEPSIGLHSRDHQQLLGTLFQLRDLGNTVIVVEHDEETIRAADHIVDLGPGAGVLGGEVVAEGTVTKIEASPHSLTGRYLRGELRIQPPSRCVVPQDKWLRVIGARENNLKNITVEIPMGLFTCVTGVSGSGKSTLVDDILRRALQRKWYGSKEKPGKHERIEGIDDLDKLVVIDQSPIGRTPRSNPVTYTGVFSRIRELFASTPASKVRGYGPGRYSFNVKGGRCEKCGGDGILKIEMHFLPAVYVECETCRGQRYNQETLEILYKGKNIAEVLNMTVDEAEEFFRGIPAIKDSLSVLAQVGLGYLKLGQQATTFSGGEAQRIKLAAELARKATGRTLYILDEPTTGLHFADIEKLLEVLFRLRSSGNTVLVIEHNLDVIQCADWVIDLGPEGGEDGGWVVAVGTPESVARGQEFHTGRSLARKMQNVERGTGNKEREMQNRKPETRNQKLFYVARSMFFMVLLMACFVSFAFAETTKEERRLFAFGQKAMEDHLYELAETRFQDLLAQFPESEFRQEAVWLLAQSRFNQGHWKEAMELLESRLPTTPLDWQDRYLFLMGEAQLKGGMNETAFQTYQDLITRFPKSVYVSDAKYGMARALLQQQKFEAAQEMLHALQKEGRKELAAKASLSLGISFFLQKKYDQASELFTRLSKEEIGNVIGAQALYALGEMDLGRKQINAARARFETLAKSDRPEAQSVTPLAFFRLGEIDAAAGNGAMAAGNYEQAFRRSDDPLLRLKCVDALVETYRRLNKIEALVEKLTDWADENSETRLGEELLLRVCTLWQENGKEDQAIQAFQNFIEKYPDGPLNNRAHFQLGWVFLNDKKYDSAASEFQKAVERSRDPQLQADAWLKIGDLNFERHQFATAASAYLKSTQIKGADTPKIEQALYQAANSNFKAGNLPEVFKLHTLYQAQYAEGKLAPEFLLLVAEAYRKAGERQKVADTYKMLVNKYSSLSQGMKGWVYYAESLYATDQFKESIQVVDQFVQKYPDHEWVPRALLIKAYSLDKLEQIDQAAASFQSLVKNYSQSLAAIEAQFWLGLYFDRQKNFAKAQEQFELLRKKAPTHPLATEATYFAARAADRLGQNKEDAPRLINALVKEYPDSPWVFDAYFLYGDILTKQREFDAALRIFNDLIARYHPAKFPQFTERLLEVQGRRGECLRQLKHYDEATAAFKTILNAPRVDTATHNQAYVELGKTFEETGDLKRALENYLAPLYERNPRAILPEERDFFWVCKGSLEAIDLLEGQRDWKGAARVLKRLMETNLPCRQEAEERLKTFQVEHADAN